MISHIEAAKDLVKLKIDELKKKIENFISENPFDFTEYVGRKREENEIDLGFLSN